MDRRTFIVTAGAAVSAGLAACQGDAAPPPRRATVLNDVSVTGAQLTVEIVARPTVESRAEASAAAVAFVDAAGSLSPVGTARAAKGGRGATGRASGGYSSAPKGRHGWAIYGGGSYGDDWRDDHEDEIERYEADVDRLGVAYLGTDDEYEEEAPGPGPVPWDETWSDPEEGGSVAVDLAALSPVDSVRDGWYRVGTKLVADGGSTDFGWQGSDLRIDADGSTSIERGWHVRPRL